MKVLIFIFPVILFHIFLYVKLELPNIYISIVQEDSVVENMQAVIYLASFIISLFVTIKFLRSKMTSHCVLYGILTLGLLFIMNEEVSWGQRIWGIQTPDFFEQYNFQKEISLHNLKPIQKKIQGICILVGAYGAFAWIVVSLLFSSTKTNCTNILNFAVPSWFISSYFFFYFFINVLFKYYPPYPGSFLVWKDQEPMELLLSLGFLSFVATNYFRLRQCLQPMNTDPKKQALKLLGVS